MIFQCKLKRVFVALMSGKCFLSVDFLSKMKEWNLASDNFQAALFQYSNNLKNDSWILLNRQLSSRGSSVLYCRGCSVMRRVFSTVGVLSVLWDNAISTFWDTISTVGITSTVLYMSQFFWWPIITFIYIHVFFLHL